MNPPGERLLLHGPLGVTSPIAAGNPRAPTSLELPGEHAPGWLTEGSRRSSNALSVWEMVLQGSWLYHSCGFQSRCVESPDSR